MKERYRKLIYGSEARQALAAGINKVADAVKVTLGPRGRTVLIAQEYGPGVVTKDGVSVARSISLEDPAENEGAKLCIAVATKSNADAGDGTTQSVVLAQSMAQQGLKLLADGVNPVRLTAGIQRATEQVCRYVDSVAKPITTDKQIEQVASISGNDPEIGRHIAHALSEVGKDGLVTLASGGHTTEVELVDGFKFDRGWKSPNFTNSPRFEAIYENCHVLVAAEHFMIPAQAAQVLEFCVKSKKPLLVICSQVDGDALVTFVMNRDHLGVPIVVVEAPYEGERQAELLEDIAQFTGAKLISPERGFDPDFLEEAHLGSCKRIQVTQHTTALFEGSGDAEEHIENLRELVSQAKDDLNGFRYKERLARLTEGFAVIKIGYDTEPELIEKKHRYEDSLNATKAAMEEGVVAGGGWTYLNAKKAISLTGEKDEVLGAKIVHDALSSPAWQIAQNAGFDGDKVIKARKGFDANKGIHCDLTEAKIIDPARVAKAAVRNAASIATLLFTTETINILVTKD